MKGHNVRFYILIISVFILVFGCSQNETHILKFAGQTMGTSYHIKIISNSINEDRDNGLQAGIDSVLHDVNMKMSTYIPQSEIYRFNTLRKSEPFEVSAEFVNVLKLALQLNKDSQGAFDVTVGPLVNLWGFGKDGKRDQPPSKSDIANIIGNVGSDYIHIIDDTHILKDNPLTEIDFSAIAKGYGVDVVGEYLQDIGFNNYLVEVGGEIVVNGTNDAKLWRVGIDRPAYDAAPGMELENIVEISNAGVATSGDYRNFFVAGDRVYNHEIDPKSGNPIVNGVASVTVIANDCMTADALATALMVMGVEKGIKLVADMEGVEAFFILRDNDDFKEVMSSGFAKYLSKD
jgi:thiamine biosynthesis lipoprotein